MIVDKLDPQEIYNVLSGFVLLCWELPIFDNSGNIINGGKGFCHRHIISSWLLFHTGTKIEEWDPSDEVIKNKSIPLF